MLKIHPGHSEEKLLKGEMFLKKLLIELQTLKIYRLDIILTNFSLSIGFIY